MTESNTPLRTRRAERVIRFGALAVGIFLFAIALYYINFQTAVGTIGELGVALPLALLFSGLWHLVRTWAWAWCFPATEEHGTTRLAATEQHGTTRKLWGSAPVSFARLARVRLAAEAFSYLTLRGIAGEPLKVVLLGDLVDAREATAAVALERIAYVIVTTWIVGVGSILALVGLPLSHTWFRVFRAFAIVAGIVAVLTALVIAGRGTYFQSWIVRIDRWLGTSIARGRVMRFVGAVERQMLELLRGNPIRLAVPADCHRCRIRLHGTGSVGHSASHRSGDFAERRGRGRDILARGQLRVRIHTGESWSTGSLESCGCDRRRRRQRRRGACPRASTARAVLGRGRPGHLSSSRKAPGRRPIGAA